MCSNMSNARMNMLIMFCGSENCYRVGVQRDETTFRWEDSTYRAIKKEMPGCILTVGLWTTSNHTLTHNSQGGTRRSIVPSMRSRTRDALQKCRIFSLLVQLVHCKGRRVGLTRLMLTPVLKRHVAVGADPALAPKLSPNLYVSLEHITTLC